jgi:serine/threonine-protein kinase RsbW
VASVHLQFTPLPEHVRTARLVAMAVARRIGMTGEVLEEVRLAVGEACARAVQRSRSCDGVPVAVEVELADDDGRLVVEVRDHAAQDAATGPGDLSLTLIEGLADTVALDEGPGGAGSCLRLEWPAGA